MLFLKRVEQFLKKDEILSDVQSIHDRVICFNRDRHFLAIAVDESFPKNDSRYGLRPVDAACVFEAGKRNPRNDGVIDKIETVTLDVECL